MNVIALNGSPHATGTLYTGLTALTKTLEQEGIATEIIPIGSMTIRGCVGCGVCHERGRCALPDDAVNTYRDTINAADGLILGSPVYYGGIAGTFKCFLDRLFCSGVNLRYKPATAVVSLRRSGGITAFHGLNQYLNLAQAIMVPTPYWSIIHGNTPDEVVQDQEGIQLMRSLGRNMAWLLKTLAAGQDSVPLPVHEPRVWTNFIH